MSIAEKLGIPCWVVHFAPSDTPTFSFPPPEYSPFSNQLLNKLSYHWRGLKLVLAASKCGLIDADEKYRKETLGLPKPPLNETVEKEKVSLPVLMTE